MQNRKITDQIAGLKKTQDRPKSRLASGQLCVQSCHFFQTCRVVSSPRPSFSIISIRLDKRSVVVEDAVGPASSGDGCNCDPTSIRRSFDGLSQVIEFTVT